MAGDLVFGRLRLFAVEDSMKVGEGDVDGVDGGDGVGSSLFLLVVERSYKKQTKTVTESVSL